jgi:hypothetical protein
MYLELICSYIVLITELRNTALNQLHYLPFVFGWLHKIHWQAPRKSIAFIAFRSSEQSSLWENSGSYNTLAWAVEALRSSVLFLSWPLLSSYVVRNESYWFRHSPFYSFSLKAMIVPSFRCRGYEEIPCLFSCLHALDLGIAVFRNATMVIEVRVQLKDASLLYFTWVSPWPESVSELYRPRDRCLSAKLVPTFADSGCHMVSMMNP